MPTITFFLFFLFIAISCNLQSKRESKTILLDTLKPAKVISKIADTLFFKKVKIHTYKDLIIFCDEANARIIVTNRKYEPIYTIAKKGDAPDELRYPLNILVRNDTLFVEDASFKINAYHSKNGLYISSCKIEAKSVFGSVWARDSLGNFYLSSEPDEEGKSILKINSQGKTLKWFGEKFPIETNNLIAHYKHIQLTGNQKIIALSRTWGYLDFYDTSTGELLKRINISHYEPIQRAIDSMKRDISLSPATRQNVRNLFMNSFYANGKLYVTFTDRIGTNRKHVRHILVFNVDESKFEVKLHKILKIKTNTEDDAIHFDALHVDSQNDVLYLQGNVTYNIYEFHLKI